MSISVISFRTPTDDDINYVARTMRQQDREEVMASSGHSPLESLIKSVKISHTSITVLADDVPLAIFGLYIPNLCGKTGSPWLLASTEAMKHKKQFLKLGSQYVDAMLSVCPYLYNYVHCSNSVSIKWLKWLGFTIAEEAIQYGVNKELFYKFEMRV